MSRKKTQSVITNIAVAIATALAWLSGYFVMQIAYDSIAASIIFGTVWAVIVFCESRFSYISLKSDGRIEITKEEIKSNFWQIVAATMVAFLVAIPLELKIYSAEILSTATNANLRMQISSLMELFSVHWCSMCAILVIILVVYLTPIFIKLSSDD